MLYFLFLLFLFFTKIRPHKKRDITKTHLIEKVEDLLLKEDLKLIAELEKRERKEKTKLTEEKRLLKKKNIVERNYDIKKKLTLFRSRIENIFSASIKKISYWFTAKKNSAMNLVPKKISLPSKESQEIMVKKMKYLLKRKEIFLMIH